MIIRKSSEDICAVCYKFELHDKYNKEDDDDEDDSDYEEEDEEDEEEEDDDNSDDDDSDEEDNVPGVEDSDDDGEEDEAGEDGFTDEERLRAERVAQLSQHLTQAQSMRLLVQLLTAEAKKCTAYQVIVSLMCITLIIDYCQNLHMPSFMKDQPGETYFHVPVNVYALGIVNCNDVKDFLHAYMYTEKEGGKTSNIIASLLMKHLKDNGLLDGNT